MNSFLNVLGRSTLKPMVGAVGNDLESIIASCGSISSRWALPFRRILLCLRSVAIASITRETAADRQEDIPSTVDNSLEVLIGVGRYIVQEEKKMVLDVPDLTGFKVGVRIDSSRLVEAVRCVLHSKGEVTGCFRCVCVLTKQPILHDITKNQVLFLSLCRPSDVHSRST